MATMFRMAAAVTLLAVLGNAGTVAHAGEGHVPRALLSQMGLSSLNVISDAEGQQVRGEGFVIGASLSLAILLVSNDLSVAIAGDVDGLDMPPLQTSAEALVDIQSVVPPLDIRIEATASGLAAAGTLPAP